MMLIPSRKFTSEGRVRLAASITDETNETVTVRFVVSDTGIGIEEGNLNAVGGRQISANGI